MSELCEDDISKLKEVVYIDSNAALNEDPILCSFKGVEDKYSTTWMYHKIKMPNGSYMDDKSHPRGCLIAKLILENNRIAYLLEIEKVRQKEPFSGLIFNTISGEIDQKTIKSLLAEILSNRGKYAELVETGEKYSDGKVKKKRILLDISVQKKLTYSHTKIKNSFVTKMNNVILESEEKDIFI